VTGYTTSPNFPTTTGPFQPTSGSGSYAFVTKFNPAGSALVYSTLLGGSGGSSSGSICRGLQWQRLRRRHHGFGRLSYDCGAFQVVSGGANDSLYEARSRRLRLVFSTYLGGSSGDQGNGSLSTPPATFM